MLTVLMFGAGALYVKSLVPHGSAAKSKQIMIGDVLFEVNGNNVYCSNPAQIGNLLLGVENSQVELSFKRGSTEIQRVILYRTSIASSPASQAQVSSFHSGGAPS
jgi:C-terminal processing protease CtpA/Prc